MNYNKNKKSTFIHIESREWNGREIKNSIQLQKCQSCRVDGDIAKYTVGEFHEWKKKLLQLWRHRDDPKMAMKWKMMKVSLASWSLGISLMSNYLNSIKSFIFKTNKPLIYLPIPSSNFNRWLIDRVQGLIHSHSHSQFKAINVPCLDIKNSFMRILRQ